MVRAAKSQVKQASRANRTKSKLRASKAVVAVARPDAQKKVTKRRARTIDTVLEPRPSASKLDHLAAMLSRHRGASIAEMMEATGWLAHSVRGALAGALKKRGLSITSDKTDGERRYHVLPTSECRA